MLSIFWLAKQRGYAVPVSVASYLMVRSSLSNEILERIFDPLLISGSYANLPTLAPRSAVEPDDFDQAKGRDTPPIFFNTLKDLEAGTRMPLAHQFAFEWANTKGRVPDGATKQDVGYFHGSQWGDVTGQFVTVASHRGRSASAESPTDRGCKPAPAAARQRAAQRVARSVAVRAWFLPRSASAPG